MKEINNFNDFTKTLYRTGFSLGGGNDEGIYAAINWGWQQSPPYETPIRWHTNDPETDPWQFRIRILNECSDIAYAKCFFRKSGYITKEFYPCFLALRRNNLDIEEEYFNGRISTTAKRIYDVVKEHSELPLQLIKRYAGFSSKDKGRFDSSLIELQMKMYLTICSTSRRRNMYGEEYGWESTVFSTTERFWQGTEVFEDASLLEIDEAYNLIKTRVLELNTKAEEKNIHKFAFGW